MNRTAMGTRAKNSQTFLLLATIIATLCTLSSKASAFEPVFGEAGHLAVSVERLSGFVHTSETTETVGGDVNTSRDTFTLLGNAVGGTTTAYSWPRVALDVFVANHFSVGGAVSFFVVSPSSGSLTGILLAPRAGYSAALNSRVSLWPRAGVTYARTSVTTGSGVLERTNALSMFALTLEVPVAIILAPRIALLVGPTIDLGLGGSNSLSANGVTTSVTQRGTEYGLNAGLLLYF